MGQKGITHILTLWGPLITKFPDKESQHINDMNKFETDIKALC